MAADKSAVLRAHPHAHVFYDWFTDDWCVHASMQDGNALLGRGASEAAAWAHASLKLVASPEPLSAPQALEEETK